MKLGFWRFDNIFSQKGGQSGSWHDWISIHAKLPLENVSIRRSPGDVLRPEVSKHDLRLGFPGDCHVTMRVAQRAHPVRG
jgi:hypothetical protein